MSAKSIKLSTAVDVVIGAFVDDTDGKTPETALTITQASCLLIKNAGTPAQKSETTSATHLGGGHYKVPLNATDTGTLGRLRLYVNAAGALPAWEDFMVMSAAAYDFEFGSTALPVNVTAMAANVVTATAINTGAITSAKFAASAIDATAIATGAITSTKFAASAINAAAIATGAITNTKFAAGAIDAAAIATDAIGAAELAADAVVEIGTGVWATTTRILTANTNLNDPTAAVIADAVWDEARAGHVVAGSYGEGVTSVQGNVTGSVASVSGNVSGSVGSVVGAVGSVTGAVGSVTGAVGSVTGNVGGNVTGSVGSLGTQAKLDVNAEVDIAITDAALATAANLAAVQADTDDIQTRLPAALVSGRMDANVSLMEANTVTASALATDAVTEITDGILAAALTESYSTVGAAPTLTQALYLIMQRLYNFGIAGTNITVTKLDGTTTAAQITTDSATIPTTSERTS